MQSTADTSLAQGPGSRNLTTILANFREVGILFFIIVLIIVVSIRQPAFLDPGNINDILVKISIIVIVAIGQMMVIVIRGIDLSVSSTIGLVGMIVGLTVRDQMDFSPVVAVLMGIVLGFGLGVINGLIISLGKVPPIIATLGTLSIYRGLVIVVSKGEWVDAYRLPASFKEIARLTVAGIPSLMIYAAIVAIAFYIFLKYTRFGRQIFALGSNPNAAFVAGIPVDLVRFTVFALSGTLAGLGGVLWASRYASVANDTGKGFELTTIAACVIGGVNVYGGAGTIPGVILGALLIGIIDNALTITRISPFWRLTVQGIVILLAVIIDAEINRRLRKQ